jgi:hypothetical protein
VVNHVAEETWKNLAREAHRPSEAGPD